MSGFDYTKYGSDTLSEEQRDYIREEARAEMAEGISRGDCVLGREQKDWAATLCTALRENDRLKAELEEWQKAVECHGGGFALGSCGTLKGVMDKLLLLRRAEIMRRKLQPKESDDPK